MHASAVPFSMNSGFGLDQYGFTGGPYCRGSYNGTTYCPTFKGRCKILAKPSIYPFPSFRLHGTKDNLNVSDAIHLDTTEAHFKEWRTLLLSWNNTSLTTSDVQDDTEVKVYYILMDSHKVVNGKVTFRFDQDLNEWLRLVASGCKVNRLFVNRSNSTQLKKRLQ